jgi:branched-subunit amino acid ABC-type transport system permease component
VRNAAYWLVVLAAAVLLIVDIADRGLEYGNLGVFLLLVVALLLRPGGWRGPRWRGE